MSVSIVEMFEIIDIQDHQRPLISLSEIFFDAGNCPSAIEYTGQRIPHRLLPQPLLQADVFADVQHDADCRFSPVFRDNAMPLIIYPESGAILPNYPIADIILPFLPQTFENGLLDPFPVLRRHDLLQTLPCRLHELFIGITEIIQHRIIDNIEGQSLFQITSGNPSGKHGKHNFHQFPAGHGIQFSH